MSEEFNESMKHVSDLTITKIDLVFVDYSTKPELIALADVEVNGQLCLNHIELIKDDKMGYDLRYPARFENSKYAAFCPKDNYSGRYPFEKELKTAIVHEYEIAKTKLERHDMFHDIEVGFKYKVKLKSDGHPHLWFYYNNASDNAIFKCVRESPDAAIILGRQEKPERVLIYDENDIYCAIPECEWEQSIDIVMDADEKMECTNRKVLETMCITDEKYKWVMQNPQHTTSIYIPSIPKMTTIKQKEAFITEEIKRLETLVNSNSILSQSDEKLWQVLLEYRELLELKK